MDARKYMIVDLEEHGKKRFMTERVSSVRDFNRGLWLVRFSSTNTVFKYRKARLLFFTTSEEVELAEKGLYIKNKHIHDAQCLQRFTNGRYTFYRVTYNSGYNENLEGRDVYVTRTPIDKNGGSTWDYLCKLAAETGLVADDEDSILSKQYNLIDVMRDNVPLAQYLGDKSKLAVHYLPKHVYYPFGCNASQKTAVEAALTHQVSIIQGPPGTGKTQTILNIISNLLIAGKTVLVVSNNNSAVENVAEKLENEGLGFIVAKLGSVKNNKEAFVANQPSYPDMRSWIKSDFAAIKKLAEDSLDKVSQGFNRQVRRAELKAEYDALLTEVKYNEMLESEDVDDDILDGIPFAKLISLLNTYKVVIEKKHKLDLFFRLK